MQEYHYTLAILLGFIVFFYATMIKIDTHIGCDCEEQI
jgi:hypothetical protein